MSTSSVTPVTFNGSSTFSTAFQQAITRAVAIASLPVQSLQSSVSAHTSQSSTLTSVGATFSALQTALQAVGSASAGSPAAQVSNSSAISATASTGALPGTYTIQVDDPGSSTVTISDPSLTTVTDPSTGNISSSSAFTLTVDGVATTVTPSGSSLEDLAVAINQSGAAAQATIVNVGSNASPDYRLSVTSTGLGPDTVQLNDGTNDLLDNLVTGTSAQYAINGSTTDVSSNSDQLTLSPGLTINLLAASSSPVTITVTNSFSGLQSALSNVVSSYNAAFNALQQNVGQNGGALTGDSLVNTLKGTLNQIAQYTASSGTVSTLSNLGITLGSDGQLAFNSVAFSLANPSDIQQFLGSASSPGFLQAVDSELSAVTDTSTGLVATDFNSVQAQITSQNAEITADQARINQMQSNMQIQLSQADATIATLQAQTTYFQQLFQAQFGTGGTNNSK